MHFLAPQAKGFLPCAAPIDNLSLLGSEMKFQNNHITSIAGATFDATKCK